MAGKGVELVATPTGRALILGMLDIDEVARFGQNGISGLSEEMEGHVGISAKTSSPIARAKVDQESIMERSIR